MAWSCMVLRCSVMLAGAQSLTLCRKCTCHKLEVLLCHAGIPEFIQGMPLSDVRLVNIKLLTLEELQLITDQGAEGRRKLDSLLKGSDRLWSQLRRQSVV